MPEKRRLLAVADIDPAKLAEFQAGIRKRYSDDQILAELRECAERLGRSPTMREFSDDKQTSVHPQTSHPGLPPAFSIVDRSSAKSIIAASLR